MARSGPPARTLKRRFRAATGVALIGRVQNLRVETAKRRLESASAPGDPVSAEVGYENPGSFRSLFKRATGLIPDADRRMFKPLVASLNLRAPADS